MAEHKRIEEERRLEELRRQEEERRLEELKRQEEQRRLEEERKLNEQRRLEEERRLKEQREKEDRRLKEQRRLEEERKKEEERKLVEEERLKELRRQELHQQKEKEQRRLEKERELETVAITTTSSKHISQHLSKDHSEDDDFVALMKGLTESLDALEQLAEEGHKIYDTLTQERLKRRPPLHNSMIETSRKKSSSRESDVESEDVFKNKHHFLKHRSSVERQSSGGSNKSIMSVKERQKKLTSQVSGHQHQPLYRTRANSETVMALEQASRLVLV